MMQFEVFDGAVAFETLLRRFVEARCGDIGSRRAAREFLDSLDDGGREMLASWLRSQEERILHEEIQRIRPVVATSPESPFVRPAAPQTRRQQAAATFGAAVEGFTRGDVDALSNFRLEYHIRGVQKSLGEMTGNDHLEAAATFQAIGSSSLLLAAIHRRIGRVLGGRRTQDVFSEDDYRKLFAHTSRDSSAPGALEALQLERPLQPKALPA